MLEEVVRGKFDVFVIPLCGSIDAGDECRAVHAVQIAVGEGVATLGLVSGVAREAEMP